MITEYAIITGSSKGLGEEIACKLASIGYNIVLHGRDERALALNRQKIKTQYGVSCKYVQGDLTDNSVLDKIKDKIDNLPVTILINNAGVYHNCDITDLSNLDIENMFKVNTIAPIILTKYAYTKYRLEGAGIIVNINSVAGKTGNPKESIYCASKFGLRGFSTSLQMMADAVKIIDVYPAGIKTDMTSHRQDHDMFIDPCEAADLICNSIVNYKSLRVSDLEIRRTLY